MKAWIALSVGLFLALATTSVHARFEPTQLCHFGPLNRSFGGTDWLVYGCKDGSLVFVAAPGNPIGPDSMMATVFEFGVYRVILPKSQEPRAVAAGAAVSHLSREQMRALLVETGALSPP